jgi:uncharacterized protein (TIGR02145 family)
MNKGLGLSLSALVVFSILWGTSNAQVEPCAYNPDFDHDHLITVTDLMGLLSLFATADSDGDCIFDGYDDCDGIVDACGVCGGTGTDLDADGICDEVDDCIGEFDDCGICNGPGAVIPVVDEVVITLDSAYFEQIDLWFVYQTDVDTLFSYICPTPGCTDSTAWNFDPSANFDDGSCLQGPPQCGEVTSVTYHGHTYPVVAIGDQCWFAENLRTFHYANGDAILAPSTESEWENATEGVVGTYADGTVPCWTFCDAELAESLFGNLYSSYAVTDERNVCPTGWHVPAFEEWEIMEEAAQAVVGDSLSFALRASHTWDSPIVGSDVFGLSIMPGGQRHPAGGGNPDFAVDANAITQGDYWTTNTHPGSDHLGWGRHFHHLVPEPSIGLADRRKGFSVRCVKDE